MPFSKPLPSMANPTKPKNTSANTLETLPSEVVIDVLSSFSSFKDLQALKSASPKCYRVFDAFSKSILTRVSKRVIDKDAWEDATMVLVYQREPDTNLSALENSEAFKADLESEFFLRMSDVPHLTSNQALFNNCARMFPFAMSFTVPAPEDPSEGVLSMQCFYQLWLLNLRFGHEKIETFAHRGPFTKQPPKNLRISILVIALNDYMDSSSARWKYCTLGRIHLIDFFKLWNDYLLKSPNPSLQDCNEHILFLKMRCHLELAILEDSPTLGTRGYTSALGDFLLDYQSKNMETLIKEYGLDEGWE